MRKNEGGNVVLKYKRRCSTRDVILRVGTVYRPAPQRAILVNIETGQARVLKTDLSETACIMDAGLGLA
jgi:hypothetical protein